MESTPPEPTFAVPLSKLYTMTTDGFGAPCWQCLLASPQCGSCLRYAPSESEARSAAIAHLATEHGITVQEGNGSIPRRDDAVASWLKARRDSYPRGNECVPKWYALDDLLEEYRLHADTGTPLDQHACEGAHCCEGERNE